MFYSGKSNPKLSLRCWFLRYSLAQNHKNSVSGCLDITSLISRFFPLENLVKNYKNQRLSTELSLCRSPFILLRKLNTEPSIAYRCFPPNFVSFWESSFREEDFQKATNLKQELPVAAMFVNGSKRNEQSLQRTFHRCFLPSFISFGQAVSEIKQ